MRIFFSTCLLIMALSFPGFAQNFESQLLVGVNASQVDGDLLVGYNKPGFWVGALVAYPFTEIFSLQTGILYSQKGSRHGQNDSFFIWRLNYVEIPILARFHAFEKLYLSTGLTANYFISSRVDTGGGFAVPQNASLKPFDFNFMIGATYQPFDRTGFQLRLLEGIGSADRLQYYRNRSISFGVLFTLTKPE